MSNLKGLEGFVHHYSSVYGERWEKLSQSLREPVSHVARLNPFSVETPVALSPYYQKLKLIPCPETCLGGCLKSGEDEDDDKLKTSLATTSRSDDDFDDVTRDRRLPEPSRDTNGFLKFYLMDAASVIAARALDAKPYHHVLDMCASPGGKSLIIASALFGTHQPNYDRITQPNEKQTEIKKEKEKREKLEGEGSDESENSEESEEDEEEVTQDTKIKNQRGMLMCNEYNSSRRTRLKKVLKDYLPSQVLQRITVTGVDGEKWSQTESRLFDRVLVDAPCSSERHLIHDPKEMSEWTRNKTKKNSERQFNLLLNALRACKKGGRVVYSTCSLSPLENEDLVSKVLDYKIKLCRVVPFSCEIGEPLRYGWMMLPDACRYGPIYLCILEKL